MTLEIAVSRGWAWLCMIFIRASEGEIPSVDTVFSGLNIVRHRRMSLSSARFGFQTEWSVRSRQIMFEATAFHILVDESRVLLHALDTEQKTWTWCAIRHVAARVILDDGDGTDESIVGNFTLRLKSWNTKFAKAWIDFVDFTNISHLQSARGACRIWDRNSALCSKCVKVWYNMPRSSASKWLSLVSCATRLHRSLKDGLNRASCLREIRTRRLPIVPVFSTIYMSDCNENMKTKRWWHPRISKTTYVSSFANLSTHLHWDSFSRDNPKEMRPVEAEEIWTRCV